MTGRAFKKMSIQVQGTLLTVLINDRVIARKRYETEIEAEKSAAKIYEMAAKFEREEAGHA